MVHWGLRALLRPPWSAPFGKALGKTGPSPFHDSANEVFPFDSGLTGADQLPALARFLQDLPGSAGGFGVLRFVCPPLFYCCSKWSTAFVVAIVLHLLWV